MIEKGAKEKEKAEKKLGPAWKLTMSDISMGASKFYYSSD